MNCAECSSNRLKTYDTRHIKDYVVRKRRCEDCGDKFFTIETYLTEDHLQELEILKRGHYHDCRNHHVQEGAGVDQPAMG